VGGASSGDGVRARSCGNCDGRSDDAKLILAFDRRAAVQEPVNSDRCRTAGSNRVPAGEWAQAFAFQWFKEWDLRGRAANIICSSGDLLLELRFLAYQVFRHISELRLTRVGAALSAW